MNLEVLVLVQRKFIGEARVLIAVQLHQQQEQPGEHQRGVGDLAEFQERSGFAPARQEQPHPRQRDYLANLDPDVEREYSQHESFLTERQLLQACGKAEAMNQAKQRHRAEQVRRLDADVLLEAVEIIERLVADGQGDHGIDQIVIGLDVQQRGENERTQCPSVKAVMNFTMSPNRVRKNITPNRNSR